MTVTRPAPLLPRIESLRLALRLVAVFGSPFRLQILAVIYDAGVLEDADVSPVTIAARLGAPLGTIAYHVRVMARAGIIETSRTRKVRGAVETFYRLTQTGLDAADLVDRLSS